MPQFLPHLHKWYGRNTRSKSERKNKNKNDFNKQFNDVDVVTSELLLMRIDYAILYEFMFKSLLNALFGICYVMVRSKVL